MLLTLLVYLAVGAVAGLSAGLFGVGGGLVIVPALVWVFTAQGVAAEVLTQLAVGTSLTTIVFTAISSIRAHHRLGNVRWPVFWRLTPGLALGVLLGAATAAALTGSTLQLAFGLFTIAVAAQMGLGLRPAPSRQLPGAAGLGLAGAVIGYVSALFGIGGGSLTVPYLNWCNTRMQQAVATSAACGLPIALVGAAGNAAVGWSQAALPPYSTGFIYWPAVLAIVATSAVVARWGAALAQRLPSLLLKRAFALLLLAVGLQFVIRNL